MNLSWAGETPPAAEQPARDGQALAAKAAKAVAAGDYASASDLYAQAADAGGDDISLQYWNHHAGMYAFHTARVLLSDGKGNAAACLHTAEDRFLRAKKCVEQTEKSGSAPPDWCREQRERCEKELANTRRLLSYLPEGPELKKETEHFLLRCHSQALAEQLGTAAEEYYEAVLKTIDPENKYPRPDKQIIIRIHLDRGSMMKSHPYLSDWVNLHVSQGPSIVSHHQYDPDLITEGLQHELCHILFGYVLGRRIRLPIWLYEGVATNLDGCDRLSVVFEKLDTEEWIDFRDLTEMKRYPTSNAGQRVNLFYGESQTLTSLLLRKRGWEVFIRFCRDMGKKKTLSAALKKHYRDAFHTPNALRDAWLKELQKRKNG